MRAISLHQPYASLIFALKGFGLWVKRHETRGKPFNPAWVGQRIAIHASKTFLPKSKTSPAMEALCRRMFGADWRNTLPRGGLLGTVELEGCYSTTDSHPHDADDHTAGDWTPGRFAWRLRSPKRLLRMISMPGRQYWWTVPEPDGFVEPSPTCIVCRERLTAENPAPCHGQAICCPFGYTGADEDE